LNQNIIKKAEIDHVLNDLKHEHQVCWNDEGLIILDVTDELHHVVQHPDLAHAEAHEQHEAERDDESDQHSVLGVRAHSLDLKEVLFTCHLGWHRDL
jgi:hypothetical protein